MLTALTVFAIGAGMLAAAAEVLVKAAAGLSYRTKISPLVIGTTVIGMSLLALSTTLPELSVTVLSARQKQDKLAVGNILGSNIFNLLLIGGVLAFFAPARMIAASQLTYLAFSTAGLAGLVFGFKGRIIPGWIGVLMLAIFGVYLKSLI